MFGSILFGFSDNSKEFLDSYLHFCLPILLPTVKADIRISKVQFSFLI